MRTLESRIKRGIKRIAEAKAEGKDTSEWEEYLFSLICECSKVTVMAGAFGFCTCGVSSGICFGCHRIPSACTCQRFEVNPGEEVQRQYARLMRTLDMPLYKH